MNEPLGGLRTLAAISHWSEDHPKEWDEVLSEFEGKRFTLAEILIAIGKAWKGQADQTA